MPGVGRKATVVSFLRAYPGIAAVLEIVAAFPDVSPLGVADALWMGAVMAISSQMRGVRPAASSGCKKAPALDDWHRAHEGRGTKPAPAEEIEPRDIRKRRPVDIPRLQKAHRVARCEEWGVAHFVACEDLGRGRYRS